MNQIGIEDEEALQIAWQQVGSFLYYFSLLEQKLNDGIGKLLGIEEATLSIMTANVDFVRKLNILRSTETFKGAVPGDTRAKLLKETYSGILALNDQRKIVAHCQFSPTKNSGVIFRRAVATNKLKIEDIEWSEADFERECKRAEKLRRQLEQIIAEMVPYRPSLDFSDPRNSMYHTLLL